MRGRSRGWGSSSCTVKAVALRWRLLLTKGSPPGSYMDLRSSFLLLVLPPVLPSLFRAESALVLLLDPSPPGSKVRLLLLKLLASSLMLSKPLPPGSYTRLLLLLLLLERLVVSTRM